MTTETNPLTRPSWRLGWYASLVAMAALCGYQWWVEQRLQSLPVLLAGAAPAYLVTRLPGAMPGPWRLVLWLVGALLLTQTSGRTPAFALGVAAAMLLGGLFAQERRLTRTAVVGGLAVLLLLGIAAGLATSR
jgi:hypothetical protein